MKVSLLSLATTFLAFLPLMAQDPAPPTTPAPSPAPTGSPEPKWDSTAAYEWQAPFESVAIPGTLDGESQNAYIYKSTAGKPMPLIVSLHTWSGDYKQHDGLGDLVQQKNWNFIHPDFRGMNNTPKSLGSKFVVQDIEDAIEWAIKNMPVDKDNIFVVGTSGGGHAACLNYVTTKHHINTTFAWVPIPDIEAWYYQSRARKNKYAGHILAATQSPKDNLNAEEARSRSPMYLPLPKDRTTPIRIFAGIHDGYTGSVPISQSLLFYNRLVAATGNTDALVPDSEIIALVSRGVPATPAPGIKIGDRDVIYQKTTPLASVTIFQGTHEMLVEDCVNQIAEIVDKGAAK